MKNLKLSAFLIVQKVKANKKGYFIFPIIIHHLLIQLFRLILKFCFKFLYRIRAVNEPSRAEPSRAEPSFKHFELGLLIYERSRARAELLNELKIRLKLDFILKKKKSLA